jgi:hypothetical protein
MPTRAIALLACLLPLAAAAQDYPKLRPGLWELTRSSERSPARDAPTLMCIDDATQRQMWDMGLGMMKGMCSKHDFKLSGNRGVGDFVCDVGGTTMRSKSVLTVTGDTAYRTEIDTTFDPPMNGQSRSRSVLEARYTGACKAGQRPGDMTLPNGQTINMRDALGGPRK